MLTGAGPRSIRATRTSSRCPHVVATRCVVSRRVRRRDRGLHRRSRGGRGAPSVGIPVLGAGEAVRRAIESSPAPVIVLSGDVLRSSSRDELIEHVAGARTVALGGTGWSHLVPVLAGDGRASCSIRSTWRSSSASRSSAGIRKADYMVEFRQGFRSMAAPTRRLEKLIVSRKLAHGGNPVTRWMTPTSPSRRTPPATSSPPRTRHRAHRWHRRADHGHWSRHGRAWEEA